MSLVDFSETPTKMPSVAFVGGGPDASENTRPSSKAIESDFLMNR